MTVVAQLVRLISVQMRRNVSTFENSFHNIFYLDRG